MLDSFGLPSRQQPLYYRLLVLRRDPFGRIPRGALALGEEALLLAPLLEELGLGVVRAACDLRGLEEPLLGVVCG